MRINFRIVSSPSSTFFAISSVSSLAMSGQLGPKNPPPPPPPPPPPGASPAATRPAAVRAERGATDADAALQGAAINAVVAGRGAGVDVVGTAAKASKSSERRCASNGFPLDLGTTRDPASCFSFLPFFFFSLTALVGEREEEDAPAAASLSLLTLSSRRRKTKLDSTSDKEKKRWLR